MTHLRTATLAATALLLLGTGIAGAQTKPKATRPGEPPAVEKKIYCWSEGGRKVCGDALPASAANSARTEISSRSGMTTSRVDRALTGSERSAAEQAAEVARQQAEALALQQRRDLAMVESYMTEADLRRAYGERTALLDETLKASKLGLSNLRLSLLRSERQLQVRCTAAAREGLLDARHRRVGVGVEAHPGSAWCWTHAPGPSRPASPRAGRRWSTGAHPRTGHQLEPLDERVRLAIGRFDLELGRGHAVGQGGEELLRRRSARVQDLQQARRRSRCRRRSRTSARRRRSGRSSRRPARAPVSRILALISECPVFHISGLPPWRRINGHRHAPVHFTS
jgi:hypothetical protein